MIEFRDVTKIYDSNDTHALENVNIKIEDGEFVFIVGSSGAGKSTFLKLIMHEEKPTSGEVIVNGYASTKCYVTLGSLLLCNRNQLCCYSLSYLYFLS